MAWAGRSQNGNITSGSCLLEQEVSISDVGSQGFILDSGVALRAYPGLIFSPRSLPYSLSGLRGLTLSLEKFFQVLRANLGATPLNLHLKVKCTVIGSQPRKTSLPLVTTHTISHCGSHGHSLLTSTPE